MARLYRFCVNHPWRVLISATILCGAVAPGLLWLQIRTDGHALVPRDAPEIGVDRAIREQFGIDDPIVVMVRSDDPAGIYNPHTLTLIDDLTTKFQSLEGVRPDNVFSNATEYGDRVYPGTLIFRRLLEPVPSTPAELARLREDVRAIKLYSGTMVSLDEKSAAIMVGAAPAADRIALHRRVWEAVEEFGGLPERVSVIGAPVAEALLGTHILEDLGVPVSLLGHRGVSQDESGFSGWPQSAYEVRLWIARTIGLVPVALLVMAGVFYVCFRCWPAVALPLAEAGVCLVVVFALMGWCGVPIYLTIAVMPIILTAAGVLDEMHVFARYRDRLDRSEGGDHRAVVVSTMEEMGPPVIMTSVTTACGFLAFALSPIEPVRAFGVFTAIGIVFCMFWTLTVIPAWLALIDARRIQRRTPRDEARFAPLGRFIVVLVRLVVNHRFVVLGVAALAALVSPWGVAKVVVQDSWIDGFAEESDFHRATTAFNEQFLGVHTLLLRVDTGRQRISGEITGAAMDGLWTSLPGGTVDDPAKVIDWRLHFRRLSPDPQMPPRGTVRRAALEDWWTWITESRRQGGGVMVRGNPSHGLPKYGLQLSDADPVAFTLMPSRLMHPDVVRRIGELEAFVGTHTTEAVGGVVGTADYVRTVNFLRKGRKEVERSIPGDVEQIEWIWREYGRIRGKERLRQLVDDDYSSSVVTVLMKNANFVGTARLMESIREYEAANLSPHGIRVSFGGDVAVSQRLIEGIVGTQVVSVCAALLGDLVVTTIMGRSILFGLLCVLPSSLAVLINFAFMGFMGMPLGVATSMFSSMTLGMGVDYAIHLLQRHRHEKARGAPPAVAVIEAVKTTGPPILGNTLAVTLGFGVLMLSQVPANARLGGLLVLSLFNCLVATTLVLPAVLARRKM